MNSRLFDVAFGVVGGLAIAGVLYVFATVFVIVKSILVGHA